MKIRNYVYCSPSYVGYLWIIYLIRMCLTADYGLFCMDYHGIICFICILIKMENGSHFKLILVLFMRLLIVYIRSLQPIIMIEELIPMALLTGTITDIRVDAKISVKLQRVCALWPKLLKDY